MKNGDILILRHVHIVTWDSGRYWFAVGAWFIEEYRGFGFCVVVLGREFSFYFNPHGFDPE